MNERKAKSAPAQGVRRKQKDKKVTTIKEINAWVHKGNSDQGNRRTARNTGLLTENVTEERLLFNKQLELGRERYKFLANHAYEKHKFIERQKRKQKRLHYSTIGLEKELRRQSLTVRIPQVDELSLSSVENEVAEETVPRQKSMEEREIYLPKTPTPRRPQSSNKGVYLDSSKSANTQLKRVAEKLPAVTVKYDVDSAPQTPKSKIYGKVNTPHGGKSSVTSGQHASPAIVTSVDMTTLATSLPSAEGITPEWANKRRNSRKVRYGERFASSIDDPRYVALHETLIPLELESKNLGDVNDIIKKHEILRRESKSFKALNSRFSHQKFLAFLLQKELTIA